MSVGSKCPRTWIRNANHYGNVKCGKTLENKVVNQTIKNKCSHGFTDAHNYCDHNQLGKPHN